MLIFWWWASIEYFNDNVIGLVDWFWLFLLAAECNNNEVRGSWWKVVFQKSFFLMMNQIKVSWIGTCRVQVHKILFSQVQKVPSSSFTNLKGWLVYFVFFVLVRCAVVDCKKSINFFTQSITTRRMYTLLPKNTQCCFWCWYDEPADEVAAFWKISLYVLCVVLIYWHEWRRWWRDYTHNVEDKLN